MKKLITTVAVAALVCVCSSVLATSVSVNYTTTVGSGYKDRGNTNWLVGSSMFAIDYTAGDYVMLIKDVSKDGTDSIANLAGTTITGDDEMKVDSVVGYVFKSNGEFNHSASGVPALIGDAYYVRIFDDKKADIAVGTYYVDVGPFLVPQGILEGEPGTLDITLGGGYTDTKIVPEPSLMMLSGLALLLLRKRK